MDTLIFSVPGLALLNFILSVMYGKNNRLIGVFSTFTLGISFLISLYLFQRVWINSQPLSYSFTWFHFQNAGKVLNLTGGYHLDSLSALMLLIVTGISTIVHLFSIEYIRKEPYEFRYWGYLGLFCFSMLGIVLSDNFLFLFIFWELVGVSSYLLIGFWFGKDTAARAAQKAFLMNRIGDLGFISAILILFAHYQTTHISEILRLIQSQPLPHSEQTLIGVLLFGGCMGKSAQFPLQVWLPDAMEGPTPVSSLIHAATMVAAGVYLLIRSFGLFTQEALYVIGISGAITAFAAAFAALSQWDIKKVLAYSTLSQLGIMVMGIGAGSPSYSMFHLVTHAFFKCGLFLCAAIIIHTIHHETGKVTLADGSAVNPQDMRWMGGLRKVMPKTFLAFMLCISALAGIPFFSGFLSKEGILTALVEKGLHHPNPFTLFMMVSGLLTTFLTALYSAKQVLWVFLGENRLQKLFPSTPFHFHDGGYLMLAPVLILGVASTFLPFSLNPFSGENSPILRGLNISETAHSNEGINHGYLIFLSVMIVFAGIAIAYRYFSAPSGNRESGFFYRLSFHHFYQNQLFEKAGKLILEFCNFLCKFDKNGVDGLVNAIANLIAGRNSRTPSLSLAVRMADEVFSDVSAEKELTSVSFLFTKFDKKWVDGIVNGVAGSIKKFGDAVKNPRNGNVQKYILIVTFVFLFLLTIIGVWIYKYRTQKPDSAPMLTQPVSNPEIYAVIRAVAATDSIKMHAVKRVISVMIPKEENVWADSSAFSLIAGRVQSLTEGKDSLTFEDWAYFKSQTQKNLLMDKDSLPGLTILPYGEVADLLQSGNASFENTEKEWEKYRKTNNNDALFFMFSPPYFSQNGQIAVLNLTAKCGSLCGGGHKVILVKREGKWQLLTKLFVWTS